MRMRFGEYGIVIENGDKIHSLLHCSNTTNPDKYRELSDRRDALREEIARFIREQEKAGLLIDPVVGSDRTGDMVTYASECVSI